MKNVVFKILSSLQKEREDRNVTPSHIVQSDLFNAVNNEIKQAINELYKEGKIEVVKTINQNAFKIKIL